MPASERALHLLHGAVLVSTVRERQRHPSGSRPTAPALDWATDKCDRHGSFRDGSDVPGPLGRGAGSRPGARVASTNTREGRGTAAFVKVLVRWSQAALTRGRKDGRSGGGHMPPSKLVNGGSGSSGSDAGSIPAGSMRATRSVRGRRSAAGDSVKPLALPSISFDRRRLGL